MLRSNNNIAICGNGPRKKATDTLETATSAMNRKLQLTAGMFLLTVFTAGAGDKRVNLLPKLRSGQTITYLIRYRSDKTVKTESNVVAPMVPNAAQMDAHGLLRIEILDVQQQGAKPAMHARPEYLALESGYCLTRPDVQKPGCHDTRLDP